MVWADTERRRLLHLRAVMVVTVLERVMARRRAAAVTRRRLTAMVSLPVVDLFPYDRPTDVFCSHQDDLLESCPSVQLDGYKLRLTATCLGTGAHAHPVRPHQTSPYANPHAAPAAGNGYGGYGSGSYGGYGGVGRGGYGGRGRGH